MRAKPSAYTMDNVFGINRPRREDAWSAEARRQCSAVRNTFRKEIRDGLAGRKKCTVQQFTSQMITRYRLGSSFVLELVLRWDKRRFHWENVGRLGDQDESVPEADDAFDTVDESPTGSPCDTIMGKKRKTLHNKGMTSGRVSDGNDYWAQVDSWFATRILEWGSDFTSSQWREFIEESLLQDDLKFNKHASKTTLLSSTTVSRPTTPSPAPPSNPLVHTSSNPFLQASNTQGTPESYVVNDNWLAVILNSQATNE
ncbi:hypothetical protein JR316_0004413 [Psilocybe cubensis]|uniref:Uncharacterized protein n=2 Tax=Psilocybe cubensis TaxID=181762 RepID=A0ACB8H549_PSICU|nr:hypothetical protein JR316_0004413 [Psilocybe cubensis]KAH9482315.1 hypothetical protein JR316_0004413 [Psilocybe cubensis]